MSDLILGNAVDLFIVTPETWGVQLLIRTGPADFSHRLVTSKCYGGHMPDGFRVQSGRLWKDGKPVEAPEEIDVLGALGLEYIEPWERR